MKKVSIYFSIIVIALITFSLNNAFGQEVMKDSKSVAQIKEKVDAKDAENKGTIVSADCKIQNSDNATIDDRTKGKVHIKRDEYNSLPQKKREVVDKNISDYIIED